MTTAPNHAAATALLSVSDKTGLVELGQALANAGYRLIASGGTGRALREAGLEVDSVSERTGYPELLGGRVKTLHPVVHGGILAQRTPEHLSELEAHDIAPIDVVVCNLYPFQATVASPEVTEAEAIEKIDIGGVTLLRAAAKNLAAVSVLCDPSDYGALAEAVASGGPTAEQRRAWALKAFRHTATYDAAIASWLSGHAGEGDLAPMAHHALARELSLRYGENPHQSGAFYVPAGERPTLEQVRGEKALSYNNLLDVEAAWRIPAEFDRPAVAIIKHGTPCGVAEADTLVEAYRRALACDPVSAFGSIIATNRRVDAAFVEATTGLFVEALAAPEYDEAAIEYLGAKKKNCRVLAPSGRRSPAVEWRTVMGGLVAQQVDVGPESAGAWTVATEAQPTDDQLADLLFAWRACKHVRSNAIVIAKDRATIGIGGGQTSRVDAVGHAVAQAGDAAAGAVLASDAFFPFADGILRAIEAGVRAVVQPGGSKRDEEVIAAANEHGVTMLFTGKRHFKH